MNDHNPREKSEHLEEVAHEIAKKSIESEEHHAGYELGNETLAQRQARLKKQRDLLLARKKQERDSELSEYVTAGGSDFSVKKDISHLPPIVSQGEIDKRRHIVAKLKSQDEPQ